MANLVTVYIHLSLHFVSLLMIIRGARFQSILCVMYTVRMQFDWKCNAASYTLSWRLSVFSSFAAWLCLAAAWQRDCHGQKQRSLHIAIRFISSFSFYVSHSCAPLGPALSLGCSHVSSFPPTITDRTEFLINMNRLTRCYPFESKRNLSSLPPSLCCITMFCYCCYMYPTATHLSQFFF